MVETPRPISFCSTGAGGERSSTLGRERATNPVFAMEDEDETTADDHTAGRAIRIGYRVVHEGPPDAMGILAAPQLIDDDRVRQQAEDLALGLILATAAGLLAAVYLAGLAAATSDSVRKLPATVRTP